MEIISLERFWITRYHPVEAGFFFSRISRRFQLYRNDYENKERASRPDLFRITGVVMSTRPKSGSFVSLETWAWSYSKLETNAIRDFAS